MKNLLIITVLFVVGFISSCKKDEVAVVSKTKKEILIIKPWIVSEVVASGVSVYKKENKPADNIYDLSKVVLTFKSDGTLSGVDNNGKAVSGAKWVLSTDETKLTITNTGIVGIDGDLPIVQLTEAIAEVKVKVTVPTFGAVDANLKMIPQ